MSRRCSVHPTDSRAEVGPAPGPVPTPHRDRRRWNQRAMPLKLICAIIGASVAAAVLLSSAGAAACTPTPANKPEVTTKSASHSEFLPKTTSMAGHNIVPQLAHNVTTAPPGSSKKQATKLEGARKPETSSGTRRPSPPNIPKRVTERPVLRTTTRRPIAGTKPTVAKLVSNQTCWSKDCKHADRVAREKMNSTVNPCQDFYNYACGNLIKKNEIRDGEEISNALTEIEHLLKSQLISLLNEKINENDTKLVNLPKSLFQLCMDTPTIEARDHVPLLKLYISLYDIIGTLGGWPILDGDKWNENSTWSWEKSMKGLRSLGFSTAHYFLNVSVEVDLKNASRRIIYVDQPNLNRVEFKTILKKYTRKQYIVEIATGLRANETFARIEFARSQQFQMNLAKITPRRNATVLYNPMLVKELQSQCNYTNWSDYFNAMLNDTGIKIDENETIIVQNVSYIKQLGQLLADSDDRDVANFVIQRAIDFSLVNLPVHLLNLTRESHPAFNNTNALQWRCLDITNERLPIALGALYIRNHFSDASRRAAVDMVIEIKNSFEVLLKSADGINNDTRETALEKLDSMVLHIGYPDELMDDKIVNEYYDALALEYKPNVTYLNTVLAIDRFATTKKFKKLRQPVNKTDWTTHSKQFDFGGFYSFSENSIQFPASYFQRELFLNGRPKYMNYGGIGLFIAREITRGFYGIGQYFDKNGNRVEPWKADLLVVPNKCFMEQYDKYIHIKWYLGLRTLTENIADNGGIKVAYHAYLKWAEKNGLEPRLPEHKRTPAQMFWLSVAQTWCSILRSEKSWLNTTIGDVTPGQFRVLGSLSNSNEFSDDFSCPLGSPMNSKKKCIVW